MATVENHPTEDRQKKLSVLERLKALKFGAGKAAKIDLRAAPKPAASTEFLDKIIDKEREKAAELKRSKSFRDFDRPEIRKSEAEQRFEAKRPASREFYPPKRPPSNEFGRFGREPKRPPSGELFHGRSLSSERGRRRRYRDRSQSPPIPLEARRPKPVRHVGLDLDEKIEHLSIQWSDLLDIREPKLKQLINQLHEKQQQLAQTAGENDENLRKLRLDLSVEQKLMKDLEAQNVPKKEEIKPPVGNVLDGRIPSLLTMSLDPPSSQPSTSGIISVSLPAPPPWLSPGPSFPDLSLPPPIRHFAPPPPFRATNQRLLAPPLPPPSISSPNKTPLNLNLRPPPPPPGPPPLRMPFGPPPPMANGYGPRLPPRPIRQQLQYPVPGRGLRTPIRFDLRPNRPMVGPPPLKRMKRDHSKRQSEMERELSELVAIIPDEFDK